MRKSPVRHVVHAHTREGYPVTNFQRGKGEHEIQTTSPRDLFESSRKMREEGSSRETWEVYTITFYYSKGRKEKVTVVAEDSDDALNHALKIRKQSLKPIRMTVKDGIISVTSTLVGGAAEFTQKMADVGRKHRIEQIKMDSVQIEKLVKMTESQNKYEASMARKELKEKYPEIYAQIAFKEV